MEQVTGIEPALFQLGKLVHHHLCVTYIVTLPLLWEYSVNSPCERQGNFEIPTFTLETQCSSARTSLAFVQHVGIEPTLFQIGSLVHHHLCVYCILTLPHFREYSVNLPSSLQLDSNQRGNFTDYLQNSSNRPLWDGGIK